MSRRTVPGVNLWIVLLSLGAGGCDFFRELESESEATDTGAVSTGVEETAGIACERRIDDQCINQDTVAHCDPSTGMVTPIDCGSVCGSFTNFSCVATASGYHACWCVEPGPHKNLRCSALEDCVEECDLTQALECAEACMTRTDAPTVRIFGALVHCAQLACEDLCLADPDRCSPCIDAARINGGGGCSVPRALCDEDRSPDEPWE